MLNVNKMQLTIKIIHSEVRKAAFKRGLFKTLPIVLLTSNVVHPSKFYSGANSSIGITTQSALKKGSLAVSINMVYLRSELCLWM